MNDSLHAHCEICHKNVTMSTIIFVGIILLLLSSCASVQKKSEARMPTTPVKQVAGAKPSEVLASLLAEKNGEATVKEKNSTPPSTINFAKNTPPKKSIALNESKHKQTIADTKPQQSVANTKQKLLAKTGPKPAQTAQKILEKTPSTEPSKTIQTIGLLETTQDASPETLNELMQTMPKGKMVFAKPQTPAAPTVQPMPLSVASTPVPLDNKTADPIDSMAAEIMHATPIMQQPEAILPPVAVAPVDAPKNNKSRGVFIPIHKGSQINLKSAAIDTLVASNSHAVLSDTTTLDDGSLLSRVKNRAFNHGVILEDKPVLVPAKQISEF
jgi:hypothetical protein